MSEIVEIANPIYDVVFKYMMENSKVSKLLISKLIGKEIETMEFKPQEYPKELSFRGFTVMRLDFVAQIRTDSGLKTVLIELQKAKFLTDIMRFRRYLGKYYSSDNQHIKVSYTQKNNKQGIRKKAIPVLPIYFLGYNIEDDSKAAVIRVSREIIDDATNKVLNIKNEFIESLSHDLIIVQIQELGKRRTE
jgi:hypothetical protein